MKRINADPTQVALHLNLLKLLQTKIFQVSSETIYEELKASHLNVAEVHYFFGRSMLSMKRFRLWKENSVRRFN